MRSALWHIDVSGTLARDLEASLRALRVSSLASVEAAPEPGMRRFTFAFEALDVDDRTKKSNALGALVHMLIAPVRDLTFFEAEARIAAELERGGRRTPRRLDA